MHFLMPPLLWEPTWIIPICKKRWGKARKKESIDSPKANKLNCPLGNIKKDSSDTENWTTMLAEQ